MYIKVFKWNRITYELSRIRIYTFLNIYEASN